MRNSSDRTRKPEPKVVSSRECKISLRSTRVPHGPQPNQIALCIRITFLKNRVFMTARETSNIIESEGGCSHFFPFSLDELGRTFLTDGSCDEVGSGAKSLSHRGARDQSLRIPAKIQKRHVPYLRAKTVLSNLFFS